MFTATAILWTVHKHGALTTRRGAGGTEKEFVKNIADCPIIFGQDCAFFLGVLQIFIIVSKLVDSWVELETETLHFLATQTSLKQKALA